MIKIFFASALISTLLGCKTQHDSTPVKVTTAVNEGLSYIALGDSYSIGESVLESERWPNQLSVALTKEGFTISKTQFIAQTGWTTRNLMDAISKKSPEKHDLVSLSIGVNNQYQHLPFDQFKMEFVQLLKIAVAIAKSKEQVFVVSIPDYGFTPVGNSDKERIGKELDEYNTFMKQECDNNNIPFIDITVISRELGSSEGALSGDNLHPSGIQYAKWVEIISPEVIKLLMK